MAKTVKGPKTLKAPKEPKAPRKQTRENPGKGHNIAEMRELVEKHSGAFFELSTAMESDMAGYRSDFGTLYDKVADATGLKKSVIIRELKRMKRKKKEAEQEAQMAADEREQTELWRSAAAGTQFGLFAEGELAKPAAEKTD